MVLYNERCPDTLNLGRIQNNQQVTIAFTSGQLNDVLKSLTVLDLNGGSITGVAYGSAAPVEKQLGDLRMGTDQNPRSRISSRPARRAIGSEKRVGRSLWPAAQRRA